MDALHDHHEYFAKRFAGLEHAGAALHGTQFEECDFTGCDFSGARFADCRFIDCRFDGCNLGLVNFEACQVRGITFTDCKVIGVNWTRASWPRLILAPPLIFRKCVLDDSSFFGLSLEEIVIEECKARDVDFREANLRGVNFSYSDVAHSLFGRTNLTGADFTEATGYAIDIFANEIKHAKFSRHEAIRLLDSLDIELID